MIVYPAIDMSGGKVVRLRKGDPDQKTIYGDDPLETARRWCDAGTLWIHIVNLDGALEGAAFNLALLARIASLGVSIQFGGGLRSLDDARLALSSGASRVVLGTMAVKNPVLAGEAVAEFGVDAVTVALDARGGKVATHGWQETSEISPIDLGVKFHTMGVRHALYTDISRDGDMRGVNVKKTAALARATNLSVIASGGVSTIEDINALRETGAGIAGVVIGKALYDGVFTLQEALASAKEGADAR